ncbi:MAG: DNA-binding domain-containing protein [Micropepsaceae bacterium]
MPLLAEVHAALRHALVFGETLPLGLLVASCPEAETQFDIHRNHFFQSLTGALEKTFPAIVSLVDQRFFSYCAHEFIQEHPPRTPCLFEYGESFPEFVAQFPPCRHLPYLGDVAQLEWNIHAVFHAVDGSGVDVLNIVRPGLPADIRLMESSFPVHRIWQAALEHESSGVDVSHSTAKLVIYRDDGDSTMQQLGDCAFEFLRAVAAGAGPLVALGKASHIDPSYSLGREIPEVVMCRLYGTHSNAQHGNHHVH